MTGIVPQMLPPGYAYQRDFYNQILPGWTNYQPPSYQAAGGRGNRQASPTQQAATMMMQQFATSPMNQESNAYISGVLGNLYGSGGAINQFHQPTSADNALERFLSPGAINPSYGGAPWAQGFNMGANPWGQGGPSMQRGAFTPPGRGANQGGW